MSGSLSDREEEESSLTEKPGDDVIMTGTSDDAMCELPQAECCRVGSDQELSYRWNLKRPKNRTPLPQHPALNHRRISDERMHFMASVKTRNVARVKENLKRDPALTTLITTQGVSALEEAVKSGSTDIIKLFLKQANDAHKAEIIEHAILYAIKEDSFKIFKCLLNARQEFWSPIPRKPSFAATSPEIKIVVQQPTIKQSPQNILKDKSRTWNDNKSKVPGYEDAEYAPYITPIILAAKLERQDMIKYLLQINASEIHPLTIPGSCPFEEGQCEVCHERKVFKWKRNLEESKRLIEVFRALSSPAYMLMGEVQDPILEAFCLSQEMYQMMQEDPSFKAEYEEIGKKCKRFATELLDLCRTTTEVEVLLKNVQGVEMVNLEGDKTEFPRVLVCLHYNQTEFIAHPYTQQVLQKSWFEGLPDWFSVSEYHYLKWMLYWLLWIPIWPFCCLMFMMKIPWFVQLMKKPINKFVTDTLSFLSFIILMVLISSIHQLSDIEKQKKFEILEYLFIWWLVGMTARQVKMSMRHHQFFKWGQCCSYQSFNNKNLRWFDMVIFLLFWFWFICRVVAIIYSRVASVTYTRNQMPSYHPILISEAFFAPAIVLCFLRLTSLFKAISSLGPLQISLKSMIRDTVRFLVIFTIIMTGFVVATIAIYSNYEGNRIEVNGDNVKSQSHSYKGMSEAYTTYFWNIFGYGKPEYADIVVNYTVVGGNQTSYDPPEHKLTEVVGYLIISSYFIVAVVVLLNMLIAMMANSYNSITDNADSEWKFARTRLWMTYYSEVGSLPPPFNVALLGTITKHIVKLCATRYQCCEILDNTYMPIKQTNEKYTKLMDSLKKRYWNRRGVEEKRQFLISKDQLEKVLTDYRVADTGSNKVRVTSL